MQLESEHLIAQIICDDVKWLRGVDSVTELGGGLLYRSPGKKNAIFDQLVGCILDRKSVAYLTGDFIYGRRVICHLRVF